MAVDGDDKKTRQTVTTVLEVLGLACVYGGIAAFSIPAAFIVLGVLLIIAGGAAA
jgi:uncharacterized membrane protein